MFDSKKLDLLATWFHKTIRPSMGTRASLAYTNKFRRKAEQLLTLKQEKTEEEAFIKAYELFYRDIMAPLICGWVISVLRTFKEVRKKLDPKAKLWWLARDAYPGFWAAKLISPLMKIDPKLNQLVHINRPNLGIVTESDQIADNLISKSPDDFLKVAEYIQQQIGDAKIIVIGDSLQYAYMIDVLNRGIKSFIVQKGNVSDIWFDKRMPKELLRGIVPHKVKLLPIVPYSHFCAPEFGEAVPAYWNYLASIIGYDLSIDSPVKLKLEALADLLEATACEHYSAKKFRSTKTGELKPIMKKINGITTQKFIKAVKRAIKFAVGQIAEKVKEEDWTDIIEEQVYHLNYALIEFDIEEDNISPFLINITAPKMSKRQSLFEYILKQKKEGKDWLGIRGLRNIVIRPKINSKGAFTF